jgi:hypothetical protein
VYQDLAEGYDLPRGIPPLSLGESLTSGDERSIPRSTVPYAWMVPDRQAPIDEEEVIAQIEAGRFDLVILGNSNRVPTIALARLRDRCRALPPIVYLDGGERDQHNAHWTHLFRPAVVFKQILTPEVEGRYRGDFQDLQVPLRLWPLPLSNPFVNLAGGHAEGDGPGLRALLTAPLGNRPIDVVSSFGPTLEARHELQRRIADTVRAAGFCGVLRPALCDPATGLTYFALLASARVALSMRGSGRDTDRYWQAPALGAVLLCDGTMGCIHPHPFQDGETAVFYRTYDEAVQKLGWLLSNEEACHQIAAAGQKHVARFHSVEARALYFLAVVRHVTGLDVDGQQREGVRFWQRKLDWTFEGWRGPVAGFVEGA